MRSLIAALGILAMSEAAQANWIILRQEKLTGAPAAQLFESMTGAEVETYESIDGQSVRRLVVGNEETSCSKDECLIIETRYERDEW